VIPVMKRLVYLFFYIVLTFFFNPFTKAPPKIDNNSVSTTIGQNFIIPDITGKYFLKKGHACNIIAKNLLTVIL